MFNARTLSRLVAVLCLALASGAVLAETSLDEIAGFDLAGMPELVSSVGNVRDLDEAVQKEIYQAYNTRMEAVSDQIMSSGADADRMFELMQKGEEKVTYELAQEYKLNMDDIGQINVIGQVQRW